MYQTRIYLTDKGDMNSIVQIPGLNESLVLKTKQKVPYTIDKCLESN